MRERRLESTFGSRQVWKENGAVAPSASAKMLEDWKLSQMGSAPPIHGRSSAERRRARNTNKRCRSGSDEGSSDRDKDWRVGVRWGNELEGQEGSVANGSNAGERKRERGDNDELQDGPGLRSRGVTWLAQDGCKGRGEDRLRRSKLLGIRDGGAMRVGRRQA
jgi:hypothetical protein